MLSKSSAVATFDAVQKWNFQSEFSSWSAEEQDLLRISIFVQWHRWLQYSTISASLKYVEIHSSPIGTRQLRDLPLSTLVSVQILMFDLMLRLSGFAAVLIFP